MKRNLSALLMVVMLAVACRRGSMTRNQKNYETVEEGSANGVTSTIQGPGETLPPITNTSVDTTGAFTIDPNATVIATSSAPPYPTTTYPTTTYQPTLPPTATPIRKEPPPPTTTTAEPEKTETTETTEPAEEAQTDTAATSTEEPPPPPPSPIQAR